MSPLRALHALREGLTDESLRFAILVGLATVPITVALSWGSVTDETLVAGGTVSAGPVLLAGLLVGYYYSDRETESRRAGIWTGLAGSIASILVFAANAVTTVGSASSRWGTAAVIATPFAVAFGVGVTVLVAMLAAQLADRVTRRLEQRHRRGRDATTADGTAGLDPKWWDAIVAYVLAAPAVLAYAGWVAPTDAVGFGLSVLGLVVLVPLSVVVLVGLFLDATAPRDREAEWIPNVWAYVGVPLGTYALVYATAAVRGSINPAGDAVYGFMGVLWLAALLYCYNEYRHDGGRNSPPGLAS